MGEAKRRGTFEQRKAQRMAKQYGLTNEELQEAYKMNRIFNMHKRRENKSPNILDFMFELLR